MPIGEFGGAPAAPAEGSFVLSSPMYWLYEMSHAALNPSRALADATRLFFKNPVNPLTHTTFGKSLAAAAELFERSTRRYSQPEWGISSTLVGGERESDLYLGTDSHGVTRVPWSGAGACRSRARSP